MIHPFIRNLVSAIREELGTPVRITELLLGRPDLRIDLSEPAHPSINALDATSWHKLCPQHPMGKGYATGWRYSKTTHSYESYITKIAGYDRMGQRKVVDDWSCDIRDVHGVGASKSNLSAFKSLSDMAIATSPDLVREVSLDALERNLAHENIGARHNPQSSDHFEFNLWSPHVYLNNSGGSHHFAAAKHIAEELGEPVILRRKAVANLLDAGAVMATLKEYEMFAIPGEVRFANELHEALASYRAGYFMHPLPDPFSNANVILLPRDDARSMQVAQTFRECGATSVGEQLARIARECVLHAPMLGLRPTPDHETTGAPRPRVRAGA